MNGEDMIRRISNAVNACLEATGRRELCRGVQVSRFGSFGVYSVLMSFRGDWKARFSVTEADANLGLDESVRCGFDEAIGMLDEKIGTRGRLLRGSQPHGGTLPGAAEFARIVLGRDTTPAEQNPRADTP